MYVLRAKGDGNPLMANYALEEENELNTKIEVNGFKIYKYRFWSIGYENS